MPSSEPSKSRNMEERLAALGRRLAEREGSQAEALASARKCATSLRGQVATALDHYHQAALPTAPQLAVTLSEPRVDDKHLHAVEFELARGRHRAIVTVKSRGEVTLVGPFRSGKAEGPCRSFPISAEGEIEAALVDFICAFIEDAVSP